MTKRYARKLRRWLWASTIGTHIGNFLSPATYCHEDVPLGIDSEQRRLDLAQEERDSLCTLFSCIDG